MTTIFTYPEVDTARWKAVLEYRSEHGIVDVEHAMEEPDELQDIVERGPDWNSLVKITIVLDRVTEPDLTVEGSQTL
jgi:hypothetical protein